MSTKIPRVIADLELQLATALAVGGESFTLSSATDDDGESLPAGVYVFAVDSGTSNKEYLLGQVNGTAVTAVKSVSRQGVQTTGAARAHRVGAPIILTNFAALQLVSDTLRGAVDLDGATPLAYDAEPTLGNREELATVGYVLDTATGGTVTFDAQTIAGTAGATIAAGDLVYFNEADQEWYLCDADTAATVEGVMRGIALGSGTDGVAITGGVHLAGAWTTTSLTAGAVYYASNTAGALATSAGTTKHIVGVALSTTRLWVIPQHRETIPTRTKDALAGGGDLGTPSSSNKFLTEELLETRIAKRTVYDLADSPATWTKPTGLKFIKVEIWGGGGNGAGGSSSSRNSAGGGGGYNVAYFNASELGSTETITIGGAATNSTFGSLLTGYRGGNGATSGSSSTYGGGGGGQLSAGTNGSTVNYRPGGSPGYPSSGYGSNVESTLPYAPIMNGTFGGGGGACGAGSAGGNSIYGGGGGGGEGGSGGVSAYGGNGGAGNASGVGANGSVPGGGGGAGSTGGGAGGAGRCIVTEYYS